MNTRILFAIPACLPLLWAFPSGDAEQSEATQGRAIPVVGPRKQTRREVVLSAENNAVLHASVYASGAFTGGEEGETLVGNRHRVVSIASYVMVGDAWEPSICHSVMTVNVDGMEEVLMAAGYTFPGATTGESFTVAVSPLAGLNWGQVKDADDLHFEVKPQ